MMLEMPQGRDMNQQDGGLVARVDLMPDRPSLDVQVQAFEQGLLGFLAERGLPTEAIFVQVRERAVVFNNLDGVLEQLSLEQRYEATYVAKFLAAIATGLFDAALNYLWDETVAQLRRRVAAYDLAYFFDNAVRSGEKRKRLAMEADLVKLDDSELIEGARTVGLISELGYQQLDLIRYHRNWASAAHPNQNMLTGLQLAGWLEICIREVIALPLSPSAVQIKYLLHNIKESSLSPVDAKEIAPALAALREEEVNRLASGLFGIYTREETTEQTRQNIQLLLPYLWNGVDEATRQSFGSKYGHFAASGDQNQKQLARHFLEIVNGEAYLPEDTRVAELDTVIENLLVVHNGYNNFYSEPAFAHQLERLVGEGGRVPSQVRKRYVLGLVEVFLTNGNGVAWDAEPVYRQLLSRVDSTEALEAILSFTSETIASRLQFKLCQDKFRELLTLLRPKIPAAAIQELIDAIEDYDGPLERLKDDVRITRRVRHLRTILS